MHIIKLMCYFANRKLYTVDRSMSKVLLETDQYVGVERTLAGVGERILAQLIDVGLMIIIPLILSPIILRAVNFIDGKNDIFYYFFFLVLYLLIPLLVEVLTRGRSVGKYVLKIQVVRDSGETPKFIEHLMRYVMTIIDIWFMVGTVGIVSIILNNKNKRLGDMAAGTIVVKVPSVMYADLKSAEINMATEYKVLYPEAEELSAGQISFIRQTLMSTRADKHDSIRKLALKLEETLSIKSRSKTSDEFLFRVLKDYEYMMNDTQK